MAGASFSLSCSAARSGSAKPLATASSVIARNTNDGRVSLELHMLPPLKHALSLLLERATARHLRVHGFLSAWLCFSSILIPDRRVSKYSPAMLIGVDMSVAANGNCASTKGGFGPSALPMSRYGPARGRAPGVSDTMT